MVCQSFRFKHDVLSILVPSHMPEMQVCEGLCIRHRLFKRLIGILFDIPGLGFSYYGMRVQI